jgi:transcriptional regulator with XRE-family HTH domain
MSKIATRRREAGLTQQGLADALGVTQAAVANWENGRRCPPVKTLRKVAEALGCTIAELIDG